MKKFLQNPLLKKLRQYRKLRKNLETLLSTGRFHTLSQGQRAYILSRLNRLFNNLRAMAFQYKTGLATAALVALSGFTQAQNFTQVTNNPFAKALQVTSSNISNNSNPTFVDMDKDNDQDLLAVATDGKIFYFQNPGSGTFVPKTGSANPFDTITKASGIAFFDVEGDNDLDLFISKSDSIYLFKNDGSNHFAKAPQTANPFGTLHNFFNPQLIFADVDTDSDLDAVLISNGSASYYSNTSGIFAAQTGTNNPFNSMSGLSDFAFVDMDNDNDLDLFAGQKFGSISYYKNTSGSYAADAANNKLNISVGLFLSAYLDAVDLNKDGVKDVVIGDAKGYFHFHNGATNMTEVPSKTSPVSGGFFLDNNFNQVAFIDLDSDSDQDAAIVIGSDSILYLENDGAGNFSNSNSHVFDNISPVNNIAFADVDNDGDKDIFVGDRGDVDYYENNAGTFTSATPTGDPFNGISSGHSDFASISFYDLDKDGDEDAFLPTNTSGTIYFNNDGDSLTQVTVSTDNPVFALPSAGYYNLGFNDIDNDGDADVFVAEYGSSGTVKLYLNGINGIDGTEEFTLNPFQSISKPTNYPHVTFADYDKDGKADAIFGGTDVTVYNKRIFTAVINGMPASTESSKIFSNENTVSLKDMESSGSVGIFNTTGSLVYQSEVKAGDSQHTLAGVPTGIYLVKVMLENTMLTRKVYLK